MVRPDKRPRTDQVITFTNADYDGVQTPHDDAMVVTLTVAKFDDKRVLIDNGSSVNIMFYDIFEKMKLGTGRLKPIDSPLYGFSGERAHVEGTIELPGTVGIAPRQSTIMVRFLIVKLPYAYNVIIGSPSLNFLGAVVSTPHLKMKFPTNSGVGEIRGDQKVARQCYLTALKPKANENMHIEVQDVRDSAPDQRGKLGDKLTPIQLFSNDQSKVVYIGSLLEGNARSQLEDFLRS
ncbi:hypothetical protein CFOL_v3_21123 [Cephalotus follicularis]|uniref:Uncharacterized protein n=1 Tax=Cephalotus follicularis TaxID=3775 RepID=A0A1Q3CC23_CEPFO|nr:hypothetical protein CFOL_v3_21123 [Cephalotus follicularis]